MLCKCLNLFRYLADTPAVTFPTKKWWLRADAVIAIFLVVTTVRMTVRVRIPRDPQVIGLFRQHTSAQ